MLREKAIEDKLNRIDYYRNKMVKSRNDIRMKTLTFRDKFNEKIMKMISTQGHSTINPNMLEEINKKVEDDLNKRYIKKSDQNKKSTKDENAFHKQTERKYNIVLS